MKDIIRIVGSIIMRVVRMFFYRLYPLLKKLSINSKVVVFESFIGRKYNDSPKAIFEYMRDHYTDYELVWVVNDPSKCEIEGATVIKRLSIKYFFTVARAKYIVNNSRMPKFFVKRPDQVYVQTWHGTPLKKLVYDMTTNVMPDTNQKKYLRNFSKEISNWDYLVSSNHYSTKHLKTAFRFEKEIIETGYPRNEMLHNFKQEDRAEFRAKYQIEDGQVAILYTPTYRDNNNKGRGRYIQDVKLDLEMLSKVTNIKVLLRVHYLVSEAIDVSKYQNIIDVSDENDINELYIASDMLLNDYSSTMFDYLILDKPIVLFPYDLKEYEHEIRGFYMDYNALPAEQIEDTERLIEIANSLTSYKAVWEEEFTAFKEEMVLKDEYHASELIVSKMLNHK